MSLLLYEDAIISISLPEKPMMKGHVVVRLQKNISTFDELSDEEAHHLMYGASYASTALFELLQAHGTNIVMNESDNSLEVHVFARFQDDGFDFLWERQQPSMEDVKSTAKSIKDRIDEAQWAKDNPQQNISSQPEQTTKISNADDEDNYLLKSLRRIP